MPREYMVVLLAIASLALGTTAIIVFANYVWSTP
jgi:hypothetical protein